jgi:precorrin-6A/cobalt-precorrin-6A reductase
LLIVLERLLPMRIRRILVLGGTSDARHFANLLVEHGYDVTTSFAGVTEHPLLPSGKIRRGGFGGVKGLRDFVQELRFDLVVDATHPFATVISRHAFEACENLVRLERPAWVALTEDNWINVSDIAAAAVVLPSSARVLLTIGRKEIDAFISRIDISGAARMIEPPPMPLPHTWQLILQRPPFPLEREIELLRDGKFTHLVTKNAGGAETFEKLAAARKLRIPVVMIARPVKPAVKNFSTVDAIAAWIASG